MSSCPELQMMRSWRSMLTSERLAAEDWLGYTPGVRRLWESTEQKGMDEEILFEVAESSEEQLRLEVSVVKSGRKGCAESFRGRFFGGEWRNWSSEASFLAGERLRYAHVATLFRAQPAVAPAYPATWGI